MATYFVLLGTALLAVLFYFGLCQIVEWFLMRRGWKPGTDARPYVFGGDKIKNAAAAFGVGTLSFLFMYLISVTRSYELGCSIVLALFFLGSPFGIYRLFKKLRGSIKCGA